MFFLAASSINAHCLQDYKEVSNMDEKEFAQLLEDFEDVDKRPFAKVQLMEAYGTAFKTSKDLQNSVQVLRDQNAKLALRVTGLPAKEEPEVDPAVQFEQEMDAKIKDFVEGI